MRYLPLCVVAAIFVLFACEPFLSSQAFAQVPPNDECSGATIIPSLPYSTNQNTRPATSNPNDPEIICNDGTGLGKTVWFKYAADATRYVYFSTQGSTPTDYDIMLGVFTGTCASLELATCNDDIEQGVVRQSEASLQVQAGTTYYILVGEWDNGGTNGGTPTGGDLVFKVFAGPPPPDVRGPKAGFVNSGATVSTDNFGAGEIISEAGRGLKSFEVNETVEKLPTPPDVVSPLGPDGSNYSEDVAMRMMKAVAGTARPVLQKSFQGIPQTNSIPPDPIVAVGPNHIMSAVNSTFRIFDKNGTVLKNIGSDAWFGSALSGVSCFDPIVMFDHFANRWIFTTLHADGKTKKAYILLSVSDDADPIGTWHNWALPADVLGDSAVSNWTDYDRVGFDSLAIYITGNQFDYVTGRFKYSKVRVIDKSKLYANTAGKVMWYDFWDFHEPINHATIFGLRPSIIFGNPGAAFLVNESPFAKGTFFTVWTVKDPLNTPTCTGVDVPVVTYFSPVNPSQLGGGSLLIEAGGSDIHNEPVYRDSSLWAVHSIASGPNRAYSAVRYVRIDPFQGKTVEDVAMGLTGYWHIYPAIMVDQDKNLIITFSRSNVFEYMGAFASGHRASDPPGLAPSITIREGLANYVKDFSTGRNRWGDYSGIALDPADRTSIWTHTEFVTAKDTWGTWIGKLKMGPVAGVHLDLDRSSITFGRKEMGTTSDTVSVTITNDGLDTLSITGIRALSQHFVIVNPPIIPRKIESLGILTLRLVFKPQASGDFVDSLVLMSNDSKMPTAAVNLTGTGFSFVKAQLGTMYATSSTLDGGRIYSINASNGAASLIGPTSANQITSLRVHPTSKELIGIDAAGPSSNALLYRVSSSGFFVQQIGTISAANLHGMAFKNDTTMYVGSSTGAIYRVKYPTGEATEIANIGLIIGGLAINPLNGDVWASVKPAVGIKDGIYKVNLSTGTATLVGQTGFNAQTPDILFDKNGKLYGLTVLGSNPNNLIVIDTATAVGALIGSLGYSGLQAIALSPDAAAGVNNPVGHVIPTSFSLEQNFPNPFNPTTLIQFSIPQTSKINLKIFDALGRVVITLAEGPRQPGVYQVLFDASHLASGIYYYRLTAGSFTDIKRMILIK
jgi:hypothetical protein